MAKIPPLPNQGQPLDVSYIYDLAKAITDLSQVVTETNNKYVTVDTVASGKQNTKTANARFVGGYVEVVTNATVTSGSEAAFSYQFTDFKYPPIVTATPINLNNTESGREVSVVLKSITNSRVDGVVKFNKSGTLSIGVNLIAIGIPN